MDFRVHLDLFEGPLDLLLHLVRRNEVDVTEVPIAAVIDQFLEHVEVLSAIDFDLVGEFLSLASTLIEIKAFSLMPNTLPDPETGEEPLEPAGGARADLVRRLIEHQRFREAAQRLEARADAWRQRYPRLANDLGDPRASGRERPLHGVELWDLVSAMGRVMRSRLVAPQPHKVVCDETPIEVFMRRVHGQLTAHRALEFESLFAGAVHRSTLVGMFLAVLELIRRGCVLAMQAERFGPILLELGLQPLPESAAEPATLPLRTV